MAEPVGITGTAAGLVSLGLQLYSEISSYLAAYKERQKDLDFARHQCANLKRCIDAIDAAITSPGFRPTVSTCRDALVASVQGCQRELDALNELVVGLQGPSSPAATVPAKLRETGRKLAFPFHQNGLQELEKRLESTVHVLQFATQTLGLDVILSAHGSLGEVKFAVDVVHTAVEDTRTDIDTISRNIECISISTDQSKQSLSSIEQKTATTEAFMAQQTEAFSQTGHKISTHIDDSTRIILNEISYIGGRVNLIQEHLTQKHPSQSGAVNVERHRLVASSANTQVTPNKLLGFANTTESVTQNGSVMKSDMIIHGSSKGTPLCSCIEYRIQKHRQAQWGPVMLQTKWRANIRHSSKCAMGRFMKNEYHRSHGFELTIPSFQSLTGKAIHVFWSLTSGTGGISLTRGLGMINTVSSKNSTTFQLLGFAASLLLEDHLADEDRWRLLGAVWRRLVWCYTSGKGSPTEQNEKGETLLYKLLRSIGLGYLRLEYSSSAEVGEQAMWLVHSLQLLHVPPSPSHNAGSHPVTLAIMGDWPIETALGHQMMHKLVNHEVDMHGSFEPVIYNAAKSSRHFDTLRNIPIAMAEVLNLPVLQIRILRQDESGVSQILKDNPSSVSETNCFGQNSVHTAVGVGNLKILRTILRHADGLSLNAQDNERVRGRYPIEYAVLSQMHSGYHDTGDIECNGCKILDAMLQSDCALYPSLFLTTFFGCTRAYEGITTNCAMRKVIFYLKERRQRLSDYAKMYLPPTQTAELDLYGGNVLDEAAGDVQTALEERFIMVPFSLRVYDSKTKLWPNRCFRSIYSYLSDSATASYAWELGFRDLGIHSALGLYEMWVSLLQGYSQSACESSKVISYVYWLLEKGLDVGKPLHCPVDGEFNFASWTASHLLSAFLARFNGGDREEVGLLLQDEIGHAATSTDILDKCRCACALDGCSPLLILLDGITVWERQSGRYLPLPTLNHYKHHFQWFCDFWSTAVGSRSWADSSKPTPVIKSILRYMTFTALELRHSCCRVGRRGEFRDWDIEEAKEVMEEQEEEFSRLDELLEELEKYYTDCPDLGTFIDVYWAPKVGMVIDELNARKLDEHEMKAAQEIGINWNCFETKTVKRDDSPSLNLDY